MRLIAFIPTGPRETDPPRRHEQIDSGARAPRGIAESVRRTPVAHAQDSRIGPGVAAQMAAALAVVETETQQPRLRRVAANALRLYREARIPTTTRRAP